MLTLVLVSKQLKSVVVKEAVYPMLCGGRLMYASTCQVVNFSKSNNTLLVLHCAARVCVCWEGTMSSVDPNVVMPGCMFV